MVSQDMPEIFLNDCPIKTPLFVVTSVFDFCHTTDCSTPGFAYPFTISQSSESSNFASIRIDDAILTISSRRCRLIKNLCRSEVK